MERVCTLCRFRCTTEIQFPSSFRRIPWRRDGGLLKSGSFTVPTRDTHSLNHGQVIEKGGGEMDRTRKGTNKIQNSLTLTAATVACDGLTLNSSFFLQNATGMSKT